MEGKFNRKQLVLKALFKEARDGSKIILFAVMPEAPKQGGKARDERSPGLPRIRLSRAQAVFCSPPGE